MTLEYEVLEHSNPVAVAFSPFLRCLFCYAQVFFPHENLAEREGPGHCCLEL